MAIADYRLTASRYVRPGTYIGFVRIPRPTAPTGEPRLPCYLGRGHRLALVRDLGHRRSFIEDEQLTFSPTPPYLASLNFEALNDKEQALLLKQNGEPVNRVDWAFRESVAGSGDFDQVEITTTAFDGTATYVIDYQSVDRAVLDDLKFTDLRKMIAVGDSEGQPKYVEFVDYRIVTQVLGNVAGADADALIPGANNSFLTGSTTAIVKTPAAAGDGAIAFNVASLYTFPYSMRYTLTITAVGAGTIDFDIEIDPLSGGNDQVVSVPAHSALTPPNAAGVSDTGANYQLDVNYPFTDGIRLDFSQTTGFDVGDVFVWDGLGAGLIEISSAHDNTNQFSTVSTPTEVTGGTSSGEITINQDTAYTGSFDRDFYFEVTAAAGAAPARTATIVVTGYNELPYTETTLSLDESVATSIAKVSLEQGIFLDFDFGVGHVAADAVNVVAAVDSTDLATAIALATEIRTDFNAHDTDVGPVWHAVAGPLHQITAAVPTDLATLLTFIADARTQYGAHLADATMHTPVDSLFGLDSTITTTTLAGAVAFLNDFKAKYNRHIAAVNFVIGDAWTMTALAARQDYTAKDDRSYQLTTTSVVAGTSIAFSFLSGTIEGGFGNVNATPAAPYLNFQDNITLAVRNFENPSGGERHAVNDTWSFTTVNLDQVDWTLKTRVTETIASDNIFQDTLGNITGVPTAFYVILDNTPETVLRVREVATGDPVSFTLVQSGGENTPYLLFLTDPGVDIEIFYEHRGAEPDPGNFYFITAHRLRAAEEYNTPILFLLREEMIDGLSPRTPDNHLYIMGDIAFDTAFFGAFFVQVRDQSGDGTFTLPDFRLAIEATETTSRITDLVVLSFFSALAASKSSIEKMNDPFEAKERFLWVGVPIGTPIGDVDTVDSLIFLATKTLQFSGDNPGRGNVILQGNQSATRTILLDDGSTTIVTLDGSFIAGYGAARNASFQDPAETLLKKDTASFETMETFNEKEEVLLGNASILFFSDVGSGLFRYGESVTVDKASPDLQEISAMNQKHFVTRFVRTRLNDNMISIVPPSPAAGVISIQGFLAETLAGLVSAGIIAPYGSEEPIPTNRTINPAKDTYVFVDENDRRLYHFGYFFNIRFPVKRLFGLFSVDARFWDNRSLAA